MFVLSNLAFINIGGGEMVFIVLIALLLFGPDKLPGLAKNVGKGMRELNRATDEVKQTINKEINRVTDKVNEATNETNLLVKDIDTNVKEYLKESPEKETDETKKVNNIKS